MAQIKELDGNWEVPGIIGTRIEIVKSKLTVLWRNSPVLTTHFTCEKALEGKRIDLRLKETGLRYTASQKDYARIASLYWQDGKLYMEEEFPITGQNFQTLEKTENSRYGNVTVEDRNIFPLLKGTWKDQAGYYELTFSKKDTLTVNGHSFTVHIVRDKYEGPDDQTYRIIDQDAAKDGLAGFYRLAYTGGIIRGSIMVCDAPSVEVIFEKI